MTPTIWDAISGPPSTPDPHSRAAAASIIGKAGSIRHRVAYMVMRSGPVSEEWLESALSLSGNTVRPRIVELSRAGIIERVDALATTRSGRMCWSYVVTDMGRRLLSETAQ